MPQIEPIPPLSVDDIVAEMRRTPSAAERVEAQEQEVAWDLAATSSRLADAGALLALDGEAFIRAIYAELLGREPDVEGLRHHLSLLASGHDKARMLLALRASPEGERRGVLLIGLRGHGRLERWFALPFIGALLRRIITRAPYYRLREFALRLEDAIRLQQHDSLAQRRQIDAMRARLKRLSGQLSPIRELSEQMASTAEALRQQSDRIAQAERDAADTHRAMQQQSARMEQLFDTLSRGSEPSASGPFVARLQQQAHLLEPLYVAFEARFRGSPELIKARQRVHLPVMLEAGAGTPERPILDLGAGRGEWLELLREQGLTARGIDLNASMVQACTALGLACSQADAVAELGRLATGSLGAVTAFHIIEHLSFGTLVALLDEALRVLAPGGVLLFETPNPANLQVGSRYFYFDPTHRNPLPSETMTMLAEARGFVRIRIEPLHPMTERFDAADAALGAQLDALLHGPMDYALIAYKA